MRAPRTLSDVESRGLRHTTLWDLRHGRAEDARNALVVALSQALWLSDTVGMETVLALRQSSPWVVE